MKRSALYYASHPEAAAKKRKYQAQREKSPEQVRYRVARERERRRHVEEHVERPVAAAGLEHQHPCRRVRRQPVGEDAARGPAAHDHVVPARPAHLLCYLPIARGSPAVVGGVRSCRAPIMHGDSRACRVHVAGAVGARWTSGRQIS